MFTIKHVALPKWTICLIKMIKSVYNLCKDSLPNWTVRVGVRQSVTCDMIFKRIFYQAGSETWRYLLGGETVSNLQKVRTGHYSNGCCTAVLTSENWNRDWCFWAFCLRFLLHTKQFKWESLTRDYCLPTGALFLVIYFDNKCKSSFLCSGLYLKILPVWGILAILLQFSGRRFHICQKPRCPKNHNTVLSNYLYLMWSNLSYNHYLLIISNFSTDKKRRTDSILPSIHCRYFQTVSH